MEAGAGDENALVFPFYILDTLWEVALYKDNITWSISHSNGDSEGSSKKASFKTNKFVFLSVISQR